MGTANGVAGGLSSRVLPWVWVARVSSRFGVDGSNEMFGHYLTLDEHSTKDQY